MSITQAINRSGVTDPFVGFVFADMNEGTPNSYFGYTTLNGAWMIKRFDGASLRFAFGVDEYTTAWAGRESLTYTAVGPQ